TGGLYPFPGTSSQARAFAVQAYARDTAPLRLDDRVPAAWRALIMDCLTSDATKRNQLAVADVLAAAEAIQRGGAYSGSGSRPSADSGSGTGVDTDTGADPGARHPRRVRLLICAAVLTAVAGAGGGWWLSSDASPSTPAGSGSLSAHAAVPAEYRGIITN